MSVGIVCGSKPEEETTLRNTNSIKSLRHKRIFLVIALRYLTPFSASQPVTCIMEQTRSICLLHCMMTVLAWSISGVSPTATLRICTAGMEDLKITAFDLTETEIS